MARWLNTTGATFAAAVDERVLLVGMKAPCGAGVRAGRDVTTGVEVASDLVRSCDVVTPVLAGQRSGQATLGAPHEATSSAHVAAHRQTRCYAQYTS